MLSIQFPREVYPLTSFRACSEPTQCCSFFLGHCDERKSKLRRLLRGLATASAKQSEERSNHERQLPKVPILRLPQLPKVPILGIRDSFGGGRFRMESYRDSFGRSKLKFIKQVWRICKWLLQIPHEKKSQSKTRFLGENGFLGNF